MTLRPNDPKSSWCHADVVGIHSRAVIGNQHIVELLSHILRAHVEKVYWMRTPQLKMLDPAGIERSKALTERNEAILVDCWRKNAQIEHKHVPAVCYW